VREFSCIELPLTVSWRCPQAVVRYAQQWVSHIQAASTAAEGTVRAMEAGDLLRQQLTSQDAILCRVNAPLVDLFFVLLRAGIPSHIEGQDIAAGLLKLVNRWKVRSLADLRHRLEVHQDWEVQRLQAAGKEQLAQTVADSVACVLAIMDNLTPADGVDRLRSRITSMFYDTEGNQAKTLTLTSIHKSKGREWPRVFWYGRNRWCPSPFARRQWQMDQERNLMYVASTRAKRELVDVRVPVPERGSH